MGYQIGDGQIMLQNQTYGLRLTIGALAEISSRLSLSHTGSDTEPGWATLMQTLQNLQVREGRVLLESLMRPCLPLRDISPKPDGSPVAEFVAGLSDLDIARTMPAICAVFENAFAE